MFEAIACATDCSASTLDALTVAKGLAQEVGGKLVIIHVQEFLVGRAGILVDSNDAAPAGLIARLSKSGMVPARQQAERLSVTSAPPPRLARSRA